MFSVFTDIDNSLAIIDQSFTSINTDGNNIDNSLQIYIINHLLLKL